MDPLAELTTVPRKKYTRPDDLPGRVCRVLEAYTLDEIKSKESLKDMVYRFTHIASGRCPHKDWMADFIGLEKAFEEGGLLSPERDAQKEMSNPKPGLPATTAMGMKLPVIADLGDGWFLVAHPNGPAIASKTSLIVLWAESGEAISIPEEVRAKAVEEFERIAWPLVRKLFYNEEDSS